MHKAVLWTHELSSLENFDAQNTSQRRIRLTDIHKLYVSDERAVFELATDSFCNTWQAGSFGALHLLDLLVLSRDVLCIDLFCFLYNVKCKIHVFVTDLQVLQGFETLSTLTWSQNRHTNHQRSGICLSYWSCNLKLHDSFVPFYEDTMSIFHIDINRWNMIPILNSLFYKSIKGFLANIF